MSTTHSTGDESPPRRRRWLIVGTAGIALIMIAAAGLVWWNIDRPDHVTTAPLDEHPLARTATETAWEWNPPEGSEVSMAHPIPSGVAVRLDDGVIALDGVTGEPTWHYQREETALTAAYTTLDTERIALTFDKEQAEDHRTIDPRMEDLLVLDTATGEIIAEQEIEEVGRRRGTNNPTRGPNGAIQDLPASGIYQLTNDTRIENAGGKFIAHSLTDGTALWQNETTSTYVREDDSISDVYSGQATVSGNTIVSGRSTVNTDNRHDWTYEIVALDADTGELSWEDSWPIGDGGDYPDPTFTLGPNTLALRLYPEEQGRILDLESGEEITTDPWPEEGGLLALTDDGYVTIDQSLDDDRGVHYYDHQGEHRHHLEPDGVNLQLTQTLALPTDESLITLGPDPDAPDGSDRGLLSVDHWESSTPQTTVPVDWAPPEKTRLVTDIEWSAETTPYLRQVPGAIVALDPTTGRITAFAP
ncbi:PQQ-binding-like beta-propeller repeat protein [Nocardiopsis sp. JB363]|uniref:outer membrane protein assembly factor BamB family protein n=1 Tax=Nocardiopsis sp. JB363 TaxID=1434837 RepID=UPI00097B8F62|nr:PQQ-binding-like beta-propeller repeat protein [Nocardiopsis sp. JB363]SIO85793.1 pyrrolo-quinoline quinone [Nocardiopsis sp. JB363]